MSTSGNRESAFSTQSTALGSLTVTYAYRHQQPASVRMVDSIEHESGIAAVNVLLMHLKKNQLPDRIIHAAEISHLTVITEPGHEQSYGPEVDVRLVENIQDIEQVRTVVLDVLRTRPIDGFLTPFELGQSQAGYLRSFFGIPGIGAEVALNFANKYVMKTKLAAAGIPVARFRLAHSLEQVPAAAEELGWPVVTKPVTGGGTHDVCVFKSREELEEFAASEAAQTIRNLRVPMIVEEFLTLTAEFHCDGVVHGGRAVFATASRYLEPLLNHGSFFGTYVLPAGDAVRVELEQLHARVVEVLGLESGVTHLEAFETPAGLVVGEIACRPAGASIPEAVRLQTGVDIWRAALETALGLAPTVEPVAEQGIIAHCYLPVSAGRVVRHTPVEELEALPHVIQVDLWRTVGDVVSQRLAENSAVSSAVVHFRLDDPAQVKEAFASAFDTFTIEVESVPE